MERHSANYVPLTPVAFLERSAGVWPDRVAVRHGRLAYTYRELGEPKSAGAARDRVAELYDRGNVPLADRRLLSS